MLQTMPDAFRVLEDDTRRAVLFTLGQSRIATVDELQQQIGCEEGDLLDQLRHLEEVELVEVDRSVDPWNCIMDSSVTVEETPTDITLTLLVAKQQRLQLSLRKDADAL